MPQNHVLSMGHGGEKNKILPLLYEEGSGKEVVEETQKLNMKPLPLGSLLAAPSPNPMHVLPTPAAYETPKTPTIKATPAALPVQNFRKLVAYVQTFVTTSKTIAAAHTAWHIRWFGCWFRCGALRPQHFYKLHQFQQPPKA